MTGTDTDELERMARALEESGRYRILRRLEPKAAYRAPDGMPTRRAVYLDLETTGLDPITDEIVEIGMVPFDFASDGRIFALHEPFCRFRDPGRPIPPRVTTITGITDFDGGGHDDRGRGNRGFSGGHGHSPDRRASRRFRPSLRRAVLGLLRATRLGVLLGRGPVGGRGISRAGRGFATSPPPAGSFSTATAPSTTAAPRWRYCPARFRAAAVSPSRYCSTFGPGAAMANPRRRRPVRATRVLETSRLPLGSRRKRADPRLVRRRSGGRARGRTHLPYARDLPAGRHRNRRSPHRRLRPLLGPLLTGAQGPPRSGTIEIYVPDTIERKDKTA